MYARRLRRCDAVLTIEYAPLQPVEPMRFQAHVSEQIGHWNDGLLGCTNGKYWPVAAR
ncbi:hypothetical protein SAMN05444172_8711 [Burkholderia sp. GAS332]|nr:hypothetical protein SAMN05444172_8711 [Burkholderia sp. GAS332]